MSTLTGCPLSAKALAGNESLAKTMFSGGPCRRTMFRGSPDVKVTDVSEGAGPEVSSTITRARGNTRGAVGAGGVLVEAGWRAPHPSMVVSHAVPSKVAPRLVHWDIADGTQRER
jgi:hypothetical protein